jgi:peptidoglycan/xylan/chitin deacetylase (PgdA/CDA1 family)
MIRRTVSQWGEFVRYDTERCLDWFHRHLNFQPTAYCLPFNDYSDRLIEVLKNFGFTTFFGRRAKNTTVIARTDIDRLLEEHPARHG